MKIYNILPKFLFRVKKRDFTFLAVAMHSAHTFLNTDHNLMKRTIAKRMIDR